jgi:Tol biopolymer transport system component
MRTYKIRFRSWFLCAVLLVVSIAVVEAQTLSVIVTLPIRGQFVFPTLGDTDLYLIDPSDGTSHLLASDDPYLESPKISPSGNQIAYHSGISSGEHNIIFDVVAENSQIVNALEGRNSEPIGWSTDGSNILYKTYSMDENYYDIHSFEVYDLNDQTLTPVGAF